MSISAWVERIRETAMPSEGGLKRVLVLCRTQPQADEIRRGIARAGGAAGVEINTLRGLAAAKMPGGADAGNPKQPPLPRNPLTGLLGAPGSRPGLEEHLASLARRLRLHESALGHEIEAEQGSRLAMLAEVARSGWGSDDTERAAARLLTEVREKGARAAEFDTVFHFGFGGLVGTKTWEKRFCSGWLSEGESSVPTPEGLWERCVLEGLGAIPLIEHTKGDDHPAVPAALVPDASAEVRLAVLSLQQSDGQPAMVLVPDEATARRFRAAAARNGLAAAGSQSIGYSAHALAPVLSTAARWFIDTDQEDPANPPVRASHLSAVLSSPLIGNRFPAALGRELAARVRDIWSKDGEEDGSPDSGREIHLSVRDIDEALRAARIMEAPLDRWIARFEQMALDGGASPLEDRENERHKRATRRRAIVMTERLRRLADCVAGRPFGITGTPDPAMDGGDPNAEAMLGVDEIDGADAMELSGRRPAPPRNTFGALRRFLLDCGVRLRNDSCGRSIIRELGGKGGERITGRDLARLLSGSASSGVLEDGIAVLPYEDYDGRPVERLVLLGCHDKGLAAAPAPDPVLSEHELAAIGVLGGRRKQVHRLLQALRAASASKKTLAVVAERDSSGRAVVPPVQLALDYSSGDDVVAESEHGTLTAVRARKESYGIHYPLDETKNRLALEAEYSPKLDAESFAALRFPDDPRSSGDERLDHLAVQGSVEWYRSGRGHAQPGEELVRAVTTVGLEPVTAGLTLAQKVRFFEPLAPSWAMPYLGLVEDTPSSWKSDENGAPRPWSVTRHFEPMCNCLYRFFAQQVLGIEDREEITDELDAKEQGTVVHGAFEKANERGKPGIRWRETEERLSQARQDALDLIVKLVGGRFEDVVNHMGYSHSALVGATRGLADRWKARFGGPEKTDNGQEVWSGYVGERILTAAAPGVITDKVRSFVDELLLESNEVAALRDELGKRLVERPVSTSAQKKWIVQLVRKVAGGFDIDDCQAESVAFRGSDNKFIIPKTHVDGAALGEFVALPEIRKMLAGLVDKLRSLEELALVRCGPVLETVTEVPFGSGASGGQAEGSSLVLELGRHRIPVKGKVDRIMAVDSGGEPLLQVLDYKTGKAMKQGDVNGGIAVLSHPQLPIYALALRSMTGSGVQAIFEGLRGKARIANLAYDYVKSPEGLVDKLLVDDAELDRFAEKIGEIVDLAEAGYWSPLALTELSWGFPKGSISLRDAARFVTPLDVPVLTAGSEGQNKSDTENNNE